MKLHLLTCLLSLIALSLHATQPSDLESKILGKWKIVNVQYDDNPPRPGYLEILGEIEIKSNRTCAYWFQHQSNPPSSTINRSANWKLIGSRFYIHHESEIKPQISHLRFESDVMVQTINSENETIKFYFKRMKDDLPPNTIEGIKRDFLITFPEEWIVVRPNDQELLGKLDMKESFIQMGLSAMAFAPTDNGNVQLTVSARKMSTDELRLDSTVLYESTNIESKFINGRKWTIETIVSDTQGLRGCHAYTYYKDGTIRICVVLQSSYTGNGYDLTTNILSTFKTL